MSDFRCAYNWDHESTSWTKLQCFLGTGTRSDLNIVHSSQHFRSPFGFGSALIFLTSKSFTLRSKLITSVHRQIGNSTRKILSLPLSSAYQTHDNATAEEKLRPASCVQP